ncbi:MAG TPA: hypothetical protein VMQ50_14285 [Casimicrobiaceae bacterium]|nr:hypothetical protein [Casimicrobiaceae bacterium]
MKNTDRILRSSLLATAMLPASMAWATISAELPPARTAGPVTYLSGGGDPAQARAMDAAAHGYPLELLFFWGRGQKETPVPVEWSIKNAAGRELLDARASGPEVLASLPDGRYTVTARYEERTLSRVVLLHRGMRDTVILEWPS